MMPRIVPAALLAVALAAPIRAQDDARLAVVLGDPTLTAGIPGEGPLTTDQIKAWLADEDNHKVLDVTLPLGLSAGAAQMIGLTENPMTRAKVELGRQLYFDTRLSADRTISCATCHAPGTGYAAPTQFGIGILDQQGNRNSPTAYNRILSGAQFWDGRAASLEEQAIGPIANPIEMGNTHDVAVDTIRRIPGYVLQFERIFPEDGVTIETIGKAIATFERAIVTGPSPFDYAEELAKFEQFTPEDLEDIKEFEPELYEQYLALKADAAKNPMTEDARRGRELFFSQRVNCSACHVGANLADELYHNLGVGMDSDDPDVGRFAVTGDPKDWGAFKTPTIRNVAQTAPYMHDGSQKTLLEVVEHYAKGGIPNKNLSDKIKPIDLTEQEKLDLVAFMEACTGPLPPVETERLPE
nr:cytochrome c peroxidase [Tautonia marina]